MLNRFRLAGLLAAVLFAIIGIASAQSVLACGGFFCIDTPVDQNAERIIFTQNNDGTVSAYVQIEYTGSAPDFSWILPLPEAIGAEDVEVPEDAMSAFRELEVATDPVFILPPLPECAVNPTAIPMVVPEAAAAMEVEVFASGEVGPYAFDVVGSEDPDALVTWLRENSYRVTEAMRAADRRVRGGGVRVPRHETAPRPGGAGRGASQGDLPLHRTDDSAAAHCRCGQSEHGGHYLDLCR